MAQYDEIVKHLMHRYADAFAMLSFGTPDVKVLETLDTEQQTVKVHRNDMTFKVLWHNEVVLLHIEVQTEDSRDKPMPLRMLAYASELLLRHELPVYSVVIYLSPNAGQTDPSGYSYGNDVFGLQYKYQVIRLADLEGESFLEATSVGLLPFTPLMKPPEGMDAETWLEKCVEKTVGAPVDSQTRGTLLFAMTTLSSLVHDLTFLQRLISEEMMREFPFIEHLKQQGARENSINNIQSVLTTRFPQSDVQGIEHALESIQDLEYLSTLLLTAIDTPSVEVFLQELNGSET
ncbi:MAG: hypothetical protein OXI67_18205 [Candidatus Poribacteria bacterium]|nr:hypothetical protein [Candidatus Poribacteria bacterium]